MPNQSKLTEYELIVELVQSNILKGYTAENSPHESVVDIDHSISNSKVISYLKELLFPEDYFDDEMNSGNSLIIQFKVQTGVLFSKTTELLGGTGGDWGYESDYSELWFRQFNLIRNLLIDKSIITEDQDLMVVVEFRCFESHIYYELGDELIEVPIDQSLINELVDKFISEYDTTPTEFRLCLWGDESGNVEIQELSAQRTTDFEENFDFSEDQFSPFTIEDLF